MPIENPDQVQWEKVAAELRAARDAQQRTWGDLDNATLGRYLADEASSAERAEIETAFEKLPELKVLTALVRDVLADSAPAEPVLVPATADTARTTWQRPIAFAPRSGWGTSRQRAAVLAAAGLLLALGSSLFRPESSGSTSPLGPTTQGDAQARSDRSSRAESPFFLGRGEPARAELVFARLDELQRQIEENQTKGDVETALAAATTYAKVADNSDLGNNRRFAPRVAAGWNQVGLLYCTEGDIDRAEHALAKAVEINRKTLGESHEVTKQTCYHLAAVYQDGVALQDRVGPLPKIRSAPPPLPADPQASKDKSRQWRDESLARFQDRLHRPETQKQVRESVLPVLKTALRSAQTAPERVRLAIAVGNLGPLARDAESVVVKCLEQARDPNECEALVRALHQMGRPPSEKTVPVLVQTLNRCEADPVRRSVANFLAEAPEGQVQLNEWAAKGTDAEKRIAQDALRRSPDRR
jgi:tetratricopeptide (TPR) repeat protein